MAFKPQYPKSKRSIPTSKTKSHPGGATVGKSAPMGGAGGLATSDQAGSLPAGKPTSGHTTTSNSC